MVARYAKFIVALVGTVAAQWPAESMPGWVGRLVAAATVLGVLLVPNAPPAGAADPRARRDRF